MGLYLGGIEPGSWIFNLLHWPSSYVIAGLFRVTGAHGLLATLLFAGVVVTTQWFLIAVMVRLAAMVLAQQK
jgi:hypothetical protein